MNLRGPADAAALLRDFLPFEERVVRRDGVRLFGIVYLDGGSGASGGPRSREAAGQI
jgi:hypothetical protein